VTAQLQVINIIIITNLETVAIYKVGTPGSKSELLTTFQVRQAVFLTHEMYDMALWYK
jgi:hypothetical protein